MEMSYNHMFLKKDAQNISRRTLSICTIFKNVHVYTEISVWSWKFGLKSWKSLGNPFVKMCKNPAHLYRRLYGNTCM